jgi:pimeloyl-ACP methyl ester carboxylesterase
VANQGDGLTPVARVKELDGKVQEWLPEDIRSIETPILLIVGDSDIVRPEHAAKMFRLLGGGRRRWPP